MNWNYYVFIGALFSGLSVILGAFGAHALKAKLSTDSLQIFETGVRYQMYHAVGLMVVGLLATRIDSAALKTSGICFIVGIFLFSGSLFVLSFMPIRAFGIATPIGGLFFVSGWIALAIAMIRLG